MDFITSLPKTKKREELIWVIIDRLTKFVHIIPLAPGCSREKPAELYIQRIVALHGTPSKIVSGRRSMFTSKKKLCNQVLEKKNGRSIGH
jgi:hypothetical protein